MSGVQPIKIVIVDDKGNATGKIEQLKVSVQTPLIFNFFGKTNPQMYDVIEGKLDGREEAMQLTAKQYKQLLAISNADGKEGLSKADFDMTNSVNEIWGFKTMDKDNFNHPNYMGIEDENSGLEIYTEYDNLN